MRRELNHPNPVYGCENRVPCCRGIYSYCFGEAAQNYNSLYILIPLPETPARICIRAGIVPPV